MLNHQHITVTAFSCKKVEEKFIVLGFKLLV